MQVEKSNIGTYRRRAMQYEETPAVSPGGITLQEHKNTKENSKRWGIPMKNKILVLLLILINIIFGILGSNEAYAACEQCSLYRDHERCTQWVYTRNNSSTHKISCCDGGTVFGYNVDHTAYYYADQGDSGHKRVCRCGDVSTTVNAHTLSYAPIDSTTCKGVCTASGCTYEIIKNHNFVNDKCSYCGFKKGGINAISQSSGQYLSVKNPTSSNMTVNITMIGISSSADLDNRRIQFIDLIPANTTRTYIRYVDTGLRAVMLFYKDTGNSTGSGLIGFVSTAANNSSTNWNVTKNTSYNFNIPATPVISKTWANLTGSSVTITRGLLEPDSTRFLYYAPKTGYTDFFYRGYRGANNNITKVTSESGLTTTTAVYPTVVSGSAYTNGWVQISYVCPHVLSSSYTPGDTTHTLTTKCSICDYTETKTDSHKWDTTHKCTICGKQGSHSGGTATCSTPATCTGCGSVYGTVNTSNHNYTGTCGTCGTANVICSYNSAHVKSHTCDVTPPTIESVPAMQIYNQKGKTVTFSIKVTDNLSGISVGSTIWYIYAGNTLWGTSGSENVTYNSSTHMLSKTVTLPNGNEGWEGNCIYNARPVIYDNAGNYVDIRNDTSKQIQVMVDSVGPTAPTATGTKSSATGSTYTAGSWTNTSVYVHLSSSDSLSGVDHYEWKEGTNGTWATCNNPASFSAARNETQYFRAVDKAGNVSSATSFKICIDKTNPTTPTLSGTKTSATGSAYTAGSWTNTAVYVHISSTDAASGINHYEWKEGTNGTWTTCNNPASFSAARNETQYFRVVDNAGNISSEGSFKISIDNTKPTINSLSVNPATWSGSSSTITAKATDSVSGISAYAFAKDSATPSYTNITATTSQITQTYSATSPGTYNFYVKDQAGNISSSSVILSPGTITGSVSITGKNIYGQTLIANTSGISPSGCSFTYQWWYSTSSGATSGTNISGATSSTYTIGSELIGKYIGVTVTASKTYYTSREFVDITDASTNTIAAVSKEFGSISYGTKTVNKTYGDASFTNTLTKTGNGTVTYTSSATGVATVNSSTGAVTIVGAGSTIITATVEDSTTYTYATKTATYTLTVNKANISPTVTMSGYTYGGTKSTPSVNGNTGSGTVTYYYSKSNTTSGGTAWTNVTSSTYLNAGDYYMYATVGEKGNYNGATTPAVKFTISMAAGYVNLSATSGTTTYGTTSKTFTVSSSHGGTLSVAESTSTAATVSISGSTVTISSLGSIAAGTTVTVRVTSAATTNYNSAYKDYTLTINKANSTNPTLTSTTATYDGESHYVTVSGGSGGTIYYRKSIDEQQTWSEWSTSNWPRVSAGTTYIQAYVKGDSNHNDTNPTASASITINKAAGYVNLSATSGTSEYGTASKTFTVSSSHGGTLSVAESTSTAATVSISESTVTIASLGSIAAGTTVTVRVTSAATGNYNSAYKDYTLTIVDTTAPTKPTFVLKYNSNDGIHTNGNWANQLIYTTISSSDAAGVTKFQYSSNKTSWSDLSLGKSGGISKSGTTYSGSEYWTLKERNETFYFRAVDAAGNVSSASDAFYIRYDITAPTAPTFVIKYENGDAQHTNGNWTNKATYTVLTSTDAVSVSQFQYSTDNGSTWTKLNLAKSSNKITASGTSYSGSESWGLYDRNQTIYFRAVDSAGNVSEASNVYYVRYDVTAPTAPTYTIKFVDSGATHTNGNWTNKRVVTTVSSTDSVGVSEMQYSTNGGSTWSKLNFAESGGMSKNGTTYSGTESWGLVNRNQTVYFRAIDTVGNVSSTSSAYYVKYDIDVPSVTVSNVNYGSNVSISVTDAYSGTIAWGVTTSTSAPTTTGSAATTGNTLNTWYTVTATTSAVNATFTGLNAGTYYAWGKDQAGNVKYTQFTVNKISVTIPSSPAAKTYNGSSQSCGITTPTNASIVTASSTTSATNAGTYTVVYALTNTTNYIWSDGTTSNKSVTWEINKATPTLSASNTTVLAGSSVAVTYTYTGDGTVSAKSGSTSVATVQSVNVTNKKVTVKGVATGSTTITLTAAEGTNYLEKTASFQITVTDSNVNITTHPNNAAVKEGVGTSFTVVASGTNLTYQWYKATSGTASGTVITGATSATYSIAASSVTRSLNGTYYYCNVTNTTGTVSSNRASLTVYYAPAITTQPTNKTVTALDSVTFSVVSSAGNPSTTTYKWQYRTSSSGTWTDVSGATSASYTISSATYAMNGYQYRVLVGNSQYANAVTSNTVTLTVNRITVTAPSSPAAKTYNGASQSCGITTPANTTVVAASSTTSATNAGTYTVVYKLNDSSNYTWSDGTTANKSINWTINKYNLSNATIAGVSAQTYTGSAIKPTPDVTVSIPSGSSTKLTTVDVTYGYSNNTNAGTATITVTAKDTSVNYTGSKSTTFIINKASVVAPSKPADKIYNGAEQSCGITTPTNATVVTASSTVKATNAGAYTVVYALSNSSNYVWSDGTTANKSVTWTINKYNLSNATIASVAAQTYTGSAIKPTPAVTVPLPSGSTTTLTTTDFSYGYSNNTNAGTATITVTATSGSTNYTGSKSATFTINKAKVTAPSVPSAKTYNGSAQSCGITTPANASVVTASSTTSATNAGTYTVVYALLNTSNYTWSDGTTANKSVNWTINKYNLSNATIASVAAQTYTGSAFAPTPDVTVSLPSGSSTKLTTADFTYGYSNNTNAGTATITVTAKDTSINYTGSKSTTFTINKAKVTAPTAPADKVYNNSVQAHGIQIPNKTTIVTASSTVEAKNVGNYTVEFALSDSSNYTWSDGTTANKSVTWKIVKATPTLSAADTSAKSGSTVVVTYTYTGDGGVSATSNNTNVATIVSVDTTNKKIEIKGGTTTGTAKITLSATAGSNYNATTAEFNINVTDASITITTQPSDVAVKEGIAVNFTVAASGTNLSYQWYKVAPGSATGTLISGATGRTYLIAANSVVKDLDGSYYYCEVSNTTGKVNSTSAKLTVYYTPGVTTHPSNQTVTALNSTTFSVGVTAGNPTATTYKWYYSTTNSNASGTQISAGTSGVTATGYNTATLTLNGVEKSWNGRYLFCEISNGQYTVKSNVAKLTVNKINITAPNSPAEKMFNGVEQSYEVTTPANTSVVTVSSTLKATNAGTYTVVYALNDSANYQWSDGSTANKSVTWKINKYNLSNATIASVAAQTFTGNPITPTPAVTVPLPSGSTTTVTTADFTYDYSNNTNVGTATITVTAKDTSTNYTGSKSITFVISQSGVVVPSSPAEKTFNGANQQHGITIPANASIVTANSTTSATNAGTYSVEFALNDPSNYKWNDGTTTNKVITWKINKYNLSNATIANVGVQTYTGNPITPTPTVTVPLPSGSTTTITTADVTYGYNDNINAGTATIIISAKDSSTNYMGSKSITFTIGKAKITVPSSPAEKTFNGTEQTHGITIPENTSIVAANSTTKATNAGTYTIEFKLNDSSNYTWEDGTTANKKVNWKINKYNLSNATIGNIAAQTYTGSAIKPTPVVTVPIPTGNNTVITEAEFTYGYNSNTNAGTANITVVAKESSTNYTGSKSATFIINKAKIIAPTSPADKVYNKAEQEHGIQIPNNVVAVSTNSVLKATNVGTYTVEFALSDSSNYTWADGTTANVRVEWKIVKATPTLSASNTSVKAGSTVEVRYTYTGDGVISATSSGVGIAKVISIDTANKKVVIDGVATGSTTINLSATAGSNYNAATASFQITVTDATIIITADPSDVSVKESEGVSFTAAATGTNLSYQWYKATSGSASGTPISGATNTTYSIAGSNVTENLNGTYYYCNVTNTTGTVSSRRALLTVYYPPKITTQPKDVAVTATENATFSIGVGVGNPSDTTYCWQYSNDGGANWNNAVSGNAATYVKDNVHISQNGYLYRCLVGNSQYKDDERVISEVATLTVNKKSMTSNDITISLDPTSAVYTGEAIGDGIIVETVKDGEKTLVKFTDYLVSYSNNTNVGTATVKISGINNYGNEKTANFTITPATPIVTLKDKNVVYSGNAVSIDVATVTGTEKGSKPDGEITYTYYTDSNCTTLTTIANSGANANGKAPVNAGTYYVKATIGISGNYGEAISNVATLTITKAENPLTITASNQTYDGTSKVLVNKNNPEGNVYFAIGTELTASNYDTVGSTANPTAIDAGTYVVYYYTPGNINYGEKSGSVTVRIAKASTSISADNVSVKVGDTIEASYIYDGDGIVTATSNQTNAKVNGANQNAKTITVEGISTGTATITINAAEGKNYLATSGQFKVTVTDSSASVTSHPSDVAVKHEETDVTFTVVASGTNLKYQWYKSFTAGGSGNAIEGATASSLTIAKADVVKELNGTYYYCEVSNTTGKTTSNKALLTVYYEPTITTHPSNRNVTAGETVTFTVVASEGNPVGLSYKWQVKAGESAAWTDIDGATSASYTTGAITAAIANYKYRAVVSNAQYSVVSNEAKALITDGNYSVNGNYYVTLEEAYNAITGSDAIIVVEKSNTDNSAFSVDSGKTIIIDMKGNTITKTGSSIETEGNLIITGNGTITSAGTGMVVKGSGNLNVTSGTVESTNAGAILNEGSGTITIGTKNGDASRNTVVIEGATYGVQSTTGIKFYDGIIRGSTASIVTGTLVKDVEDGYEAFYDTENVSGTTYQVAYLETLVSDIVLERDKATWTNTDVVVTITWPETKYPKQIKVGDGAWQDFTGTTVTVSNNTIVYARVISGTEVKASAQIEIDNIDKLAPKGKVRINSGAEYTNSSDVVLTLTDIDNESGVSEMAISNTTTVNGFEPFETTKDWTLSEGEGVKGVFVVLKDAAGNMSVQKWGNR